jgi:hypothetical protein
MSFSVYADDTNLLGRNINKIKKLLLHAKEMDTNVKRQNYAYVHSSYQTTGQNRYQD